MSRRSTNRSDDALIRVIQVGPQRASAHSRGGIATVMSLVLAHPSSDAHLDHVVTYGDGHAAHKIRLAVTGFTTLTHRLLARDVDVVHAHMSFKGSVLRKGLVLHMARTAGVPTVLHAHSHGFTRWFTGLPRYQQKLVRALLQADRWVVLGARWAEEYAELLHVDPRRVTVLHNPTVAPALSPDVDWTWPDAVPNSDSRQVRMVFLGRLGERKGCFDLIRALSRLDPDVRSSLHIVMAGDGDQDGVVAAARAAGVDSSLEFPGWIDEATRAALLDTGDVLLLPSHQEGLPMAVLEGMAAGLAILTTPVGGIPEVITDGEHGILVTPGDEVAIATALERLVRDDDLRARLGASARERSSTYDVEHWYAALDRLWRDVAAEHVSPSTAIVVNAPAAQSVAVSAPPARAAGRSSAV